MAEVAIVSACFGGFDQIRAQEPQDIDVDWVMFTDDPELEAPGWEVRVQEAGDTHPCLRAKQFKMRPPVAQRRVVWIDANTEITSESFAREALAYVHDGIALFLHPRRACIYEEAEASLGAEAQSGKYAGQPIREQVAAYRAEGHPEKGGLYACGTLSWDRRNPRADHLGLLWLEECWRWSFQDQISFPVVCRRLGIVPGTFIHPQLEPGYDPLGNRWQLIHSHL